MACGTKKKKMKKGGSVSSVDKKPKMKCGGKVGKKKKK